jgi:hypothetical protein
LFCGILLLIPARGDSKLSEDIRAWLDRLGLSK